MDKNYIIKPNSKIAIIDADLNGNLKKHRFPNLVCMKLSGFYKNLGHQVELKLDYIDLDQYDKIFIAKAFTSTEVLELILKKDNVIYGGTGFFYDKAIPLPHEIEHFKPDYQLYSNWVSNRINEGEKRKNLEYYLDYSIGYTTRGCIRGCKFCVNKNYKSSDFHSPLEEFIDDSHKYICLLDDNVLACKDWKNIFDSIHETKKYFQYKQGMDERLLTEEKCDYIFNKSKYKGDYIFAFDNIKDEDTIVNKLKLIRNVYKGKRALKFYVFCGFNHDKPDYYNNIFWDKDILDTLERIKILMEYKCLPYLMRYIDYEKSPYRGLYINLARWCNQPQFFKKKSFREFCEANQKLKKDKTTYCSAYKSMFEFESKFPELANKYFDCKY